MIGEHNGPIKPLNKMEMLNHCNAGQPAKSCYLCWVKFINWDWHKIGNISVEWDHDWLHWNWIWGYVTAIKFQLTIDRKSWLWYTFCTTWLISGHYQMEFVIMDHFCSKQFYSYWPYLPTRPGFTWYGSSRRIRDTVSSLKFKNYMSMLPAGKRIRVSKDGQKVHNEL